MADGKYPMKKKGEEEEEEEIKEAVRRVRKMQYLEVKDGRLWLHAKTAKLEKTSDVTWTLVSENPRELPESLSYFYHDHSATCFEQGKDMQIALLY